MNFLIFFISILLSVLAFVKYQEYVLAILLVGHPFLKIMLIPFNGSSVYTLVYYAIGLVSVLLNTIRSKEKIIVPKYKINMAFSTLIICVFLTIYATFSVSREDGYEKMLSFLSSVIVIVISIILLYNTRDDLFRLTKAITNIAIIVGVLTLYAVYKQTGSFLVRVSTTAAQEVKFFGVNLAVSIWYGRRMSLGCLAAYCLYEREKTTKNTLKFIILMILTLLSVSRGPIISLLLSVVALASLGKHSKKATLLICITAATGIVGYFIIRNTTNLSTFSRLVNFSDGNASTRLLLYREGINLFREHPMGVGLGGFAKLGSFEYPHNIIIELLAETGIIGTAFFLLLVFMAFAKALRSIKIFVDSNPLEYFPFLVTTMAVCNAMFSGNICSNEYVALGICLSFLQYTHLLKDTMISNNLAKSMSER